MAIVIFNQGKALAMKALVNHTAPQNLVLRLFKSNTTPAVTDTEATYTEADFTGYSAATLTGGTWSVTEANPSVASYAQQSFTSSADQAAQSVYGYYYTQATSGKAIGAERFADAPVSITNNGDVIKITPNLTGT